MMDLTDLPGSARREGRPDRQRRRARRLRAAIALLVALALLAGGAWAAWGTLKPVVSGLTASDDYDGTGSAPVEVQVADGDTGTAIGKTLTEAGVVKTQGAFVTAATAQPKMSGIQPGTYRLKKQMSAASAVALLLDPASRITTRLTIPEGLLTRQVLDRIAGQTQISRADLDAALADPAALGLPPAANGNVEGYLFPATWDVDPNENAVQLLSAMVARTGKVLADLGVPPERVHDVVVEASIAQKEARTPADMARVVTVLRNRLAIDMPLQLDSTVSYAVNGDKVTTTDAQRATDSPYNTYRYPGLPIGPISNPGEDALRAAMNPEPGPWLFFVTVNLETGETRFATTGAEHAANVELFRAYLREHPEAP